MVTVRIATPADAQGILHIYAPHVSSGVASFEYTVPTLADIEARIVKCLQKYPWLVCEHNGTIAGYVYASTHREREAYQWTCECSVYVHADFEGKGIARQLYTVLFNILQAQGFRNVYAGITLPNIASAALHESMGFRHFAIFENIGCKFGQWHSTGWWRLQLQDFTAEPEAPVPFPKTDRRPFEAQMEAAARKIENRFTG